MLILAIDPGPERSGVAVVDTSLPRGIGPRAYTGKHENKDVLAMVRLLPGKFKGLEADAIAIEDFQCYGRAVGKTSILSIRWGGRFWQAAHQLCIPVAFISNPMVRSSMCGQTRGVKDANIKQAVLDCFPATGGGACPQKGTKAKPGPLYGISGQDAYDALAIGLTAAGLAPFSDGNVFEREALK